MIKKNIKKVAFCTLFLTSQILYSSQDSLPLPPVYPADLPIWTPGMNSSTTIPQGTATVSVTPSASTTTSMPPSRSAAQDELFARLEAVKNLDRANLAQRLDEEQKRKEMLHKEPKKSAFQLTMENAMGNNINNNSIPVNNDNDDDWDDDADSANLQDIEIAKLKKEADAAAQQRRDQEKKDLENQIKERKKAAQAAQEKNEKGVNFFKALIQNEEKNLENLKTKERIISVNIRQNGYDYDNFTDEYGILNLAINQNDDSETQDEKSTLSKKLIIQQNIRDCENKIDQLKLELAQHSTGSGSSSIMFKPTPTNRINEKEAIDGFLENIRNMILFSQEELEIEHIIEFLKSLQQDGLYLAIQVQPYNKTLHEGIKDILTLRRQNIPSPSSPSSSLSSSSSNLPLIDPKAANQIDEFINELGGQLEGERVDTIIDYLVRLQQESDQLYPAIDINDLQIKTYLHTVLKENGLS